MSNSTRCPELGGDSCAALENVWETVEEYDKENQGLRAELGEARAEMERLRSAFAKQNAMDEQLLEKVRGHINAEHPLSVDMCDGTGLTGMYIETGYLRSLLDTISSRRISSTPEDAEYWGRMYAVETDRANKAIEALHRTEADLNAVRREMCFTIQAITQEQAPEVAASRGWQYLYAPAPPATGTEEGGDSGR